MLTQKRAQEVWAQRGLQNRVDHLLTPEEYAYVIRVWDAIPSGRSSWMSAFFLILNGQDPLHQMPVKCPSNDDG